MTSHAHLYGQSLALLTDLYQVTMAYGYWKTGAAEKEAAFHLFFRSQPFDGGFSVACGLAPALEFLRRFRVDSSDLDYLSGLRGGDEKPLFEEAFLDHLRDMRMEVDLDAAPEGTLVFPHEPMVRVRGPILQCQLLETPLLTLFNFPTLIATKSARVCLAAQGDSVLEFGLRRAQGIDGGVSASRAAYVGGCDATSNVLAGKLFGIPVKGTHAHSWVMSFDSELESFDAWAQAMPNNSVFLVDTYDTLEGVRNAIRAGRRLRERGFAMMGVRLDSGDLAELSIEARRLLDEAGFPDAKIVASSDLDEYAIQEMKGRGSRIAIWGVGTKLATAYDQPALGGVYKLSAVRKPGQSWDRKVKLSERRIKTSIPGVQQARRYRHGGRFCGDIIYDEEFGLPEKPVACDRGDVDSTWSPPADAEGEDLLAPVLRSGQVVYAPPSISDSRQRTLSQLDALPEQMKRLNDVETYRVGLERRLAEERQRLVEEAESWIESRVQGRRVDL